MGKCTQVISKLLMPRAMRLWNTTCRTTFFGPEILSSAGLGPYKEKRTFYSRGYLSPFVLHVLNGDQTGNSLLTGGELWLNKKLLLGSADFAQTLKNRQINIELNDLNELEILAAESTQPFTLTIWVEGMNRWNYQGFFPEIHARRGE